MKLKKFEEFKVSSFDRSYKNKIKYTRPEKYKEIEQFSKNFDFLITMGSNLSYAPLSFAKHSVCLDLSKFNRILNFNKKKKEITVEAGIKIIDLLNFLLNHGLWLPQLPGYPLITLGGAVATNAHGKSSGSNGTIRNSVKKILLFHKNRGWLTLSNDNNKQIFDLTIGGLGLTGTIVSITLKLTAFKCKSFLTKRYEVKTIKQAVSCLDKFKNDKDLLVYSWLDASSLNIFGRGYVFVSKPSYKKKNEIFNIVFKKKRYFLLTFWNKLTSKIFNTFYFKYQKFKKKKYLETIKKTIFPFAGNENYFNFYGEKGFLESQLIVPRNVLSNFFIDFKKYYQAYNPEIILFSIKNISGMKKFIRFEGQGLCVTFDYTNKKKNLNFMKKIDMLCVKYKIIPSIIKDSRISKSTFEKCFLETNLFRKKLIKFDKKRVYQSETSKRLKI